VFELKWEIERERTQEEYVGGASRVLPVAGGLRGVACVVGLEPGAWTYR